MIVTKAKEEEYDALQRFLENSYGHAHDFFPHHYPWCWREENTDFGHVYLIKQGSELASLVRVFPLELNLGHARVSVAGIGGVATSPLCSGKGYMSALLNHAITEMKAEGFPVSMLWGDQHRYQPFGYQNAGKMVTLTITERGIRKDGIEAVMPTRVFDQADLLKKIAATYQTHPFHRIRRDEELSLIYQNARVSLFCGGDEDKFGYLALFNDSGAYSVAEFGGNATMVLRISAYAMKRFGISSLELSLPNWDLIPQSMIRAASHWRVEPTGKIKILDLEKTLQCFRPQSVQAFNLSELRSQAEVDQVNTLFGTANPSPFNIFIWPLDQV